MQQSAPEGSDYLGFGKDGSKTYQEVLKLDPEYCRWVEQVEDQQSHWKSVSRVARCVSNESQTSLAR